MIEISKELLSEVLGIELENRREEPNPIPVSKYNNTDVVFYWKKGEAFSIEPSSINIYELQHKMKQWAFDKGYNIWSDYLGNVQIQDENFETIYSTSNVDVEVEAIFKACEYIRKETKC